MSFLLIQQGETENMPLPQYPGPVPQSHDSGKPSSVTDIQAHAGGLSAGPVASPGAPSIQETSAIVHMGTMPPTPAARSKGVAHAELPQSLGHAATHIGRDATERSPATCSGGLQEVDGGQEGMEMQSGGGGAWSEEGMEEGGSDPHELPAEETLRAEEREVLLRPAAAADPGPMVTGDAKGMLTWTKGVTRWARTAALAEFSARI